MFPVFLLAGALWGVANLAATESSYIKLVPSTTVIAAGDRFSVDVFAYAHVPVNAVDISLSFNPSSFIVEQVDRGQSVLTIWTEDPIITRDSVTLRGGTYRRGFIGEHKIATIELTAKQTGEAKFSANKVLLLAGDGAGSTVPAVPNQDDTLELFVYDTNTNPDDISVAVGVHLITDIDGDGSVTLRDISSFMGAWASKSRLFDFNGDNRMTIRDFSIILADYFFK
jgi:hypothetical protein